MASLGVLIEKRWGIAAVILGFLAGFISAYLCIIWGLVIFGFNIMYIISPLLAGFIETMITREKYGRSTGAISALLIFILINLYGWFIPATPIDPTKEPVTLSLITLIAIVLTLQAAFPTLVNYVLIVTFKGSVYRLIQFLGRLGLIKAPETGPHSVTEGLDDLWMEMPLVSVPGVNGDKIKSYLGLVAGEAVAEEVRYEGRFANLMRIIEPPSQNRFKLTEARRDAISVMLDRAASMGANAVVEVIIDHVSVGGLQGSAVIVTATGTAVVVHEDV
ncbi:YbjQ family protein [Methanothermobacter wolfeii]|uniref:YbjQ family protein n=1 Tax=Methanothermobacter wolfeii TaxID=145261 RepID=UPI0024B37E0E|nr:heavy metal-binding domain-containing protein [Methanothermobacter wolfeii]MDI6701346.1 heavy metal-binding domain-containing protein [Methanothermobacter wolfeii]